MSDNKRRENSILEHKRNIEEKKREERNSLGQKERTVQKYSATNTRRRKNSSNKKLQLPKKHMLVGAIIIVTFLGVINLYGRSRIPLDKQAIGQQVNEQGRENADHPTPEGSEGANELTITTQQTSEKGAESQTVSAENIDISKYNLPSQIKPEMLVGAIQARNVYDVPASLAIAQIIEESSGSYAEGLSELAYEYKNLFGVKGEGTAGSVSLLTNEYTPDGEKYSTYADFAAYNNYEESLDHHGRILTMENYKNVTAGIDWHSNLDGWVRAIAIEYATSPEYGDSLVELIDRCGLRRFDSMTLEEL